MWTMMAVALPGLLGVLGGPHAMAQTGPAAGAPLAVPMSGRVDVDVRILLADNQPGAVTDARLLAELPSLKNMPFSHVRLLEQHDAELADGEQRDLLLMGGRTLRLTLLSHDTAQGRLRVELWNGSMWILNSTVSVMRGKTFFLAVRLPDASSLLLPVRLRY
jgi:hypothetical protein